MHESALANGQQLRSVLLSEARANFATVGEQPEDIAWPTEAASATFIALLLMGVYVYVIVFLIIVLLNLLIAIMTDSYEQVKESEIVEDRKGRARLVVEHERLWPAENVFPRFMHVLRPAEGGGEEVQPWEGVAGKMKQVEDRLTARLLAENAELRERLNKQDETLDEMRSEMREAQATLLKKMEEMAPPKSNRR